MLNVFEIPTHPAADIFPMLSHDELMELADDIAENGLREPIVLQKIDEEVLLIDGRNRRAACEMAKIQPAYRWLHDEDTAAFIFSTNIARRHLTAGQRAMAHARLYPVARHGGARVKGQVDSVNLNCDKASLSRARFILSHAPMKADEVMSGIMSLNAAYEEVKTERARREVEDQRLSELVTHHPDLATMVAEGQLSLGEAIAASRKRDEEDRHRIAGMNDTLATLAEAWRRVENDTLVSRLATFIRDEREQVRPGLDPTELLDTLIRRLSDLKQAATGSKAA